jgi:ATP-binding cassette subfamily B protein
MKRKISFTRQLDHMDCGPACLKMIASYYGKEYTLEELREKSEITRYGVSFLGLSEAAEKIGFTMEGLKVTKERLIHSDVFPCILHWNKKHFVVLYACQLKRKWLFGKKGLMFYIGDPAHGLLWVSEQLFIDSWQSDDHGGVVLCIKPAESISETGMVDPGKRKNHGLQFFLSYAKPYRKYIIQIYLGMILSSLLSLALPFLTQSLVDEGIKKNDIQFIYLVLISQLMVFIGSALIDMIRNWIVLHINIRISVKMISNFLMKLMRLPIRYFESKNVGDITQRIADHQRVEVFLTGSTLGTLFSVINLVIFSIVLCLYNTKIFFAFVIGSMLSVWWVLLFLKKRKQVNYSRFQLMRENQNKVFEIISGMSEIKLNSAEETRNADWEKLQVKLFKLNARGLVLEQGQEIGFAALSQLKNILISFLSAMAVIHNQITLGMMLGISYIVGQLNGPLLQLINFVRNVQDAKISFDRLCEIHDRPNEEDAGGAAPLDDVADHPGNAGIRLQNVSFRYGGARSPLVLRNLNLHIPRGKITAIVGSSGSGKTTLLKLLLKYYSPQLGKIRIDDQDLEALSAMEWRRMCGSVMQDGYLFSDTVATNVIMDMNDGEVNMSRLNHALRVANIHEFINGLTSGVQTTVGASGSGLSGGQRQRILIARAVYKDPRYLFFDEATNGLDSNNERIIMKHLDSFFKGRTVVIIAHRLSTVKNADQIVVMENGEIVEVGTHIILTEKRGKYYDLVKNQLDLELYE